MVEARTRVLYGEITLKDGRVQQTVANAVFAATGQRLRKLTLRLA